MNARGLEEFPQMETTKIFIEAFISWLKTQELPEEPGKISIIAQRFENLVKEGKIILNIVSGAQGPFQISWRTDLIEEKTILIFTLDQRIGFAIAPPGRPIDPKTEEWAKLVAGLVDAIIEVVATYNKLVQSGAKIITYSEWIRIKKLKHPK